MQAIREKIAEALKAAGVTVAPADVPFEHTADFAHGDYATSAALAYSKQLGTNPRELAQKLVDMMGAIEGVSKIEIAGPGFINFTLDAKYIFARLEGAINNTGWNNLSLNQGKRIMIEYTDPNPFKEFHIGHLMSNAIGESLSRLLIYSGAEIKRANYQGDVGPHVAKAIYGMLQKEAEFPSKDSSPTTKAKFLGAAYVLGANLYEDDKAAKAQIDIINKKIYDRSDKKINELYDWGRKVSLDHFEDIYKLLDTKFDFRFFESQTGSIGQKIVQENSGVFAESDGATIFRGEDYGLHTRVFLNSQKLPTYEAKELGLFKLKQDEWNFDESITITASEQKEYFKVVLEAAKRIPEISDIARKTTHVTHGMMRFAEGKMSSRKGNVITGESLVNDLTESAEEISRNSLTTLKVKVQHASDSRRTIWRKYIFTDARWRILNAVPGFKKERDISEGSKIAVGAIKYVILRQGSGKDIIFDAEKSLSLEGDSGPYLQYANVRASSILTKASQAGVMANFETSRSVGEIERLLYRFPEIAEQAVHLLEPHIVTNYLINLASTFNSWYAREQILDQTEAAKHKVAITHAVQATLAKGLWLLAIPTPERM